MGMRIWSWEWEGMGSKNSFPHTSTPEHFINILIITQHQHLRLAHAATALINYEMSYQNGALMTTVFRSLRPRYGLISLMTLQVSQANDL